MNETERRNIFIIPHLKKQFIIYMPLQGILFTGNASAVNLFYKALEGNVSAQNKFGLNKEVFENLSGYESRYFVKNEEEVSFKPTSVSLFFTSDCSMRCTYCYASGGERKIHIKEEFIKVAINEVVKNALLSSLKSININYHGGGDIGVVWNLVEETTNYLTTLANENNLKVNISAGLNGVLNNYQREWIVKRIQSATVSIDGYREIHDHLRPLKNGEPSFNIVYDTLKYFDDNSFNYALRTTVTSENIKYLDRIISYFCENFKAKKIRMEPVFVQGRAISNNVNMPSAKEFVRNFLKAKKIAESYSRELSYSGARFDIVTDSFCLAAGSSFGITPEGNITSCYEVLDSSNQASEIFFYGKIKDGEILIDRNKISNLKKLTVAYKEKCNRCFARFHCAGDCPVKAFMSDKDELMSNYRCFINRELTKAQLLKSII
jgi:uncharacterized protein